MNQSQSMRSSRRQGVRRSGVGTGTTSLLMIFTVLCFATLAMLSLSTAESQQRIQQRGLATARSRAVAQGLAAEQVADLDAGLLELRTTHKGTEADYFEQAEALAAGLGWQVDSETHTITLNLIMDDKNTLMTQLELLGPKEGSRYKVVNQSSFLTDGWEPEPMGHYWMPTESTAQ